MLIFISEQKIPNSIIFSEGLLIFGWFALSNGALMFCWSSLSKDTQLSDFFSVSKEVGARPSAYKNRG